MNLGFTGTRRGLSEPQRVELVETLARLRTEGARDFHYGDCVGADAEAFDVAFKLGYWTVAHLPTDDRTRAQTFPHIAREPLPFLERNRAIVEESDILIACPGQLREVLRSGTWATIRYARRIGRLVILIWPDGKVAL